MGRINYKNSFFETKMNKDGSLIIGLTSSFFENKKFEEITPAIYEFLDEKEEIFGVWLERIPYCVLTINARDHIVPSLKGIEGEKKKQCDFCKHRKDCPGFPLGYFKKHGSNELKPIFDLPEEVMIEIESRCNFNCQFCFNKISFAKLNRNIKEFSFIYIKKILDGISRQGIKRVRFTGGEPLLYPEIIEVIKYAKNKKLEVVLNTNGYFVDKKLANSIKGFVDDVLIPIESWSEKDEENTTGHKYALRNKIRAVKLLKNIGVPLVRIGTVAVREAINNFEKIYNIISTLPIDSWELFRPISSNIEFTNDDMEKIISKIAKTREKGSFPISLANAIPFCSVKNIDKMNSLSAGALYDEGHRRLVVDARGFVKPHYFIDKNIGDPLDIIKAWNNPFMKKMRQLKFAPDKCKKCLYVHKCCGGSRYLAKLKNGKWNSIDPITNYENYRTL